MQGMWPGPVYTVGLLGVRDNLLGMCPVVRDICSNRNTGEIVKPRTKRESIWKMELDELEYVCHTRKTKRWIKRQLSKARRALKGRG